MFALALVAAAVPPPPPIVTMSGRAERGLVAFDIEDLSCPSGPVAAHGAALVLPEPMLRSRWDRLDSRVQDVRFAIDASGRTRAIGLPEDAYGDDVAPAVAALRFPAGPPRESCHARVAARYYAADRVPSALAALYWTMPARGRKLPVFDRIVPEGSDCGKDMPRWLVRAQPDFDSVPSTPGKLDFVTYRFAIDEAGETQDIEPIYESGNADLVTAGKAALAQWRFETGKPRRDCSYGFWRGRAVPLPSPAFAPSLPSKKCPDSDFASMPDLAPYYPDNFRRRAIEGVARLRYSAAPWGEIGDIEIIASEPADAFGDAGKRLLARARLEASDTARIDCTVNIAFALPDSDGPAR